MVPLSQLLPRRSKRNARKTPRLSVPELAASIALLQNFIVILAADGEQYEVVASGRYAMLNDGMGFSLVPWKPVIEQRLGQQLAATVRGREVS
ncbi:hypothetical protein BIY31_17555 [Gibbsiella quercinecans]|nr:hypothetical protein BIY31_17555 [Gibbsiella quercinecans]